MSSLPLSNLVGDTVADVKLRRVARKTQAVTAERELDLGDRRSTIDLTLENGRGVLLWNTWGQVDGARALIAEPGPFQTENLKGRLPAPDPVA